MQEQVAQAVLAEMDALEQGSVRAPKAGMACLLQQAHELLTLCRAPEVGERLRSMGLVADFDQQLEARLDATRLLQSKWSQVRAHRTARRLREVQGRAGALRRELLAAVRFHLRIARTHHKSGAAALVQDLFDLAALLELHAQSIARDPSFDVAAQVRLARSVAYELSLQLSDTRTDLERDATRESRNRAFTLLDNLMTTIRTVGRYAYRSQPEMLRRFASSPRRRVRRSGSRGI